jgi:hypothetical protein
MRGCRKEEYYSCFSNDKEKNQRRKQQCEPERSLRISPEGSRSPFGSLTPSKRLKSRSLATLGISAADSRSDPSRKERAQDFA